MSSPGGATRTVHVVLTANVNGYTGGLNRANEATARWQRAGENAAKAVRVGLVASATAATGLVAAAVRTGVAYNNLQQTTRAALTTLLGSASAANAQMDKLDTFARTSPFAKQVFITAQQQLLGFGLSAQKVLPYLSAIQDVTAAIGGDGNTIASISGNIAQVVSGGFSGDFFNSMSVQSVDAAKVIGDQLGKSAAQIRAMVTAGTLDTTEGLDALIAGLEKRYAGAAANVKNTWAGATDRIKAGWRDLSSELVKPFVNPKGGGMGVEWANRIADVLRAAEKKAGPVIDHVIEKFSKLSTTGVDGVFDRIIRAIDNFDPSSLDAGLDSMVSLFGDARDILGQLLPILGTVGSTSATIWVAGVQAARPFVEALTAVLRLFNALPDSTQKLIAAGLIVALLASKFTMLTGTIARAGGATVGLIAEMRTLYVMANANGVAISRMGAATSVLRGRMQAAGVAGKVGFGAIASGVLLALPLLGKLNDSINNSLNLNPATGSAAADAVAKIASQGKVSGDVMKSFGATTDDLGKSLHDVFNPGFAGTISNWGQSLGDALGISNSLGAVDLFTDVKSGNKALKSLDEGLSQLVSGGHLDQAQKAFQVVAEAAAKQGVSVDQLNSKLPQYGQAVQAAKAANAGLTAGLDDQAGAADTAASKLAKLRDTAADALSKESPLTDYSPEEYQRALDAVATAQDNVAKASRDYARAQKDAAQQVAESERAIVNAQRDARQAQDDLTQARKDAAQALADLDGQLKDSKLSETAAQIAVARAKQRLDEVNNDPLATDLDRAEAENAYQQAVRASEEATKANNKAQADANELRRKGVNGADAVVAAQQRVIDANQAVADSERAAAQTAIDARQSVVDSYAQLSAAQQALTESRAEAFKTSMQGTFDAALHDATVYVNGISELVARGLNTDLIAQLLEAGPAKAAPIIQQLLGDHSGRLITLANNSNATFASLSSGLQNYTDAAGRSVQTLSAYLSTAIGNVHGLINSGLSGIITAAGGNPGNLLGTQRRADGGWVVGAGGPRDDKVLVRASPREFVVNAKQMSYDDNAATVAWINAGGRARDLPRFADGGMVSGDRIAARTLPAVRSRVSGLSGDGVTPRDLAAGFGAVVNAVTKLADRPVYVETTAVISARQTYNAVKQIEQDERKR